MSNSYAKSLFTIAAIFNWLVGASWLLAWPTVQELFQLGAAEGSNRMLINVCAMLIIAFGYAYFLVSRDPVTYRHYIKLGAIAKLMVVAATLPVLVTLGEGYLIGVLALGDLLFAMLFMHFLRSRPLHSVAGAVVTASR